MKISISLPISLLICSFVLAVAIELGFSTVVAQNISDNATEGNMTTGTIVTNGTTVNMTNASTPMITNTT
jgi:hypothetical protein